MMKSDSVFSWLTIFLTGFLLQACSDALDSGQALMHNGRYREAIVEFHKLDSTSSRYKEAIRNIAQCYLRLAWLEKEKQISTDRATAMSELKPEVLDTSRMSPDDKAAYMRRLYDILDRYNIGRRGISQLSLAYFDSIDVQCIDTQTDTTYSNYCFYLGKKLFEAGQLKDAQTIFERVSAGSILSAAKDYLSQLQALVIRAAQIQPLRAVIAQTPFEYTGYWLSKPTISDLRMTKDLGRGIIEISFALACTKKPSQGFEYISGLGRFRVRLFDHNGNYLTHFSTEPLYKLLGIEFTSRRKQYSISYGVNLRDLRDTEIGELGLILPN